MRDVKKSLKKKNDKENVKEKEMFIENPFVLAVIVFAAAFFINYLLELDFTKNLFNWIGYYFNYSIYSLNSVIQPTFKDHPYIHIAVITNPVTPELMAIINPWMWLRGFIISTFAIAQTVTVLQIKKIESKNIVTAVILIGLLQLGLYLYPYSAALTLPLFMSVTQKFYINILTVMAICLLGLLAGVEYAVYLFRNDKIQVTKSKTDGPNINVKVTDKLDW